MVKYCHNSWEIKDLGPTRRHEVATGYTYPLHDGVETSFVEFVASCAGAFGARIKVGNRLSADVTIAEQYQTHDWYEKSLAEERRRLAGILAWDEARAEREAKKMYRKLRRYYVDRLVEVNEMHCRYKSMLEQVEDWSPPSCDHRNLKVFMIEQLTSSIENDCSHYPHEPPRRYSGAEFKAMRIADIERTIAYKLDRINEETDVAIMRTTWLRLLLDDLADRADATKA